MRRGLAGWSIALTKAAQAGSAVEVIYLSDRTLCGEDWALIEEHDAIVLSEEGMGNHFFDCTWDSPIRLRNISDVVFVGADCENGQGQWRAEFEIVPREGHALRVFQTTGGITPVAFDRCQP